MTTDTRPFQEMDYNILLKGLKVLSVFSIAPLAIGGIFLIDSRTFELGKAILLSSVIIISVAIVSVLIAACFPFLATVPARLDRRNTMPAVEEVTL